MDQHIGDDAHQNTVGNAISKRHQHNAYKAGNAGDVVGEVYLANVVHHHHTDQYQGGCRGLTGNGQEERRKE